MEPGEGNYIWNQVNTAGGPFFPGKIRAGQGHAPGFVIEGVFASGALDVIFCLYITGIVKEGAGYGGQEEICADSGMVMAIQTIPAPYHPGRQQGDVQSMTEIVITGLAGLMRSPFALVQFGDVSKNIVKQIRV